MTRDLLRLPGVRRLVVSRWPQLLLRVVMLGGFVLAILAGWLGTSVGSRNFGIIAVWIAWWAALIMVAVPLVGRGWCGICPIPMPGEWLQNRAVLGPRAGSVPPRLRRWPRALRNTWIQNGAFLVLALFSAVILTTPLVTAVVLGALILVAVGTSLVFERRAFCRYLCPVSGFIGLYSQAAPVEVRVKDTAVCAGHNDKTCYSGSDDGYGCPWDVFPAGLQKNTDCGLCMECVRTCPYDNIAFQVRPVGDDLTRTRGQRVDEAFKALIMVASALIYSVVMLGPWSELKTAAYAVGTFGWLAFALAFAAIALVGIPGVFYAATWLTTRLSPTPLTPRRAFVRYAYSLVPLGLAAWIGFSLAFVLANGSYVWPVLSDPLGWGWDLLGTANVAWNPYLSGLRPVLQATVLLGGLAWATVLTRRTAVAHGGEGDLRAGTPVMLFHLATTIALLWLLVA